MQGQTKPTIHLLSCNLDELILYSEIAWAKNRRVGLQTWCYALSKGSYCERWGRRDCVPDGKYKCPRRTKIRSVKVKSSILTRTIWAQLATHNDDTSSHMTVMSLQEKVTWGQMMLTVSGNSSWSLGWLHLISHWLNETRPFMCFGGTGTIYVNFH